MSQIPKARRRGLADEVAEQVRSAILEGRFEPGSALREVELAAALEVSRGAVREGLGLLIREGLVHSGWHRGTTVIEVTVTDVEEVYAVRGALERLAALTVATQASPKELDELDYVVDRMATAVAEEADAAILSALDIEFHDTLYRIAGNSRLSTAWHGIRAQVQLFQLTRARLGYEHYRGIIAGEHRELIGLLRARNTKDLNRFAEEHVQSACRLLTAQLAAGPPA
ncbi:GntR family transcriptional regulator [Sciscionella marina]|uniref:GntR family transcriptional regulator n=1 Tax=Sciscionella marina TaxID=508770 RepID=UPI00037D9567|nr:GntR family transcriptional regulator [Sciscionella marina]